MGGIYIGCGEFIGDDKSGSAIDGVLGDIIVGADAEQREAIGRIISAFNGGEQYIEIGSKDARPLLPLMRRYRSEMLTRIAPITDPFEQIEKDHQADPDLDATEAKYGKSTGWKLYCATDLETALALSVETGDPVILTWD